jgi:urease beta subunit
MRPDDLPPGAVLPGGGEVEINAGLPVTTLRVTNTGAVPVHLTAHFHVFEANPRLRFDRRRAFGMRPDVPAGGAIRLEPGETRDVPLVPIGGRRVVLGFAGLVDGALDETDIDAALARALARGYLHEPEDEASDAALSGP